MFISFNFLQKISIVVAVVFVLLDTNNLPHLARIIKYHQTMISVHAQLSRVILH